jgi:hypothetical protein
MLEVTANYRRLAKVLNKTRKSLTQTCHELGIDVDDIEDHVLVEVIDQCSHCNIWSQQLVKDLDYNPVCPVCVRLTGL